ncbi:MAG: Hsp20/alpha crystallin family protein [Bryobacteraceae bacterium]|nr:Hsp20/alpha crystallin family protein [Bryobacteraceae bacterium]
MTVFLFSPPRQGTDWQPALDIYKVSDGWILKFDLAGVRLDDVHAHVAGNRVTVAGVRRDWLLDEVGCHHYSMEISYSRFQRAVELPEDFSDAKFRLEYRDGILFMRITRREEPNNE